MIRLIKYCILLFLVGITSAVAANYWVVQSSKQKIYHQLSEVPETYTVIVLGAKVYDNGNVSTYLKGRLDKALELYEAGKVTKFLLSGDHGTKTYDEVNTMKEYLMEHGISKEIIFLDHAGFNTYNTMARAMDVFMVEEAVIVSQDYHLNRAVYIANQLGMNAIGYAHKSDSLPSIKFNKKREFLARVKSFGEVLLKVPPKYLGDAIPITGSSAKSHD